MRLFKARNKVHTIKVKAFYGDERSKATIGKSSKCIGSALDLLIVIYGSVFTYWNISHNSASLESPIYGTTFGVLY